MIVLGADTSGRTLSVALARGNQLLGEYSLAMGYRHSVTFQPLVNQLLDRCDLTLRDVELFALAAGPGSFTGIRIGLASVQAMAYAVGAKAMGVSSLRALARSAGGDKRMLTAPILDARGGRVFSSLYRGPEQLIEEAPRDIRSLFRDISAVAGPNEEVLVTGDGIAVWEEALADDPDLAIRLPFDAVHALPPFRYIRASAVIGLALEDLARGKAATDPWQLSACYGIASSAERARRIPD
ncbi:MAG TPA: tRNA (adenosine(37)-N6)-threonylcarbamoyltransferase complex dimerization subunit type 1 TsaB [Bacillota bacterium]|nr:tRNA (adenosine(37)-N6)-threonylcarbamoyltransferase complex dimerization subunit type 1 TsaB [Fastidiosipila sp.]HPX93108.1 tRNA (adenosine(37)-N6)-threonylcarbamoyltransferase complex dimerization subunit type 1 TsaB [Bacillota bacterium]HQB81351.1 tRNA (adenosine(37)-N6)-threonylcarbamoyltransferase complex dimerization subunit type 1 TsaB [Bacillota bacterium]